MPISFFLYTYLKSSWGLSVNYLTILSVFEGIDKAKKERSAETISVGSRVRIYDFTTQEESTVTMVLPRKSSPEAGLVSCLSPLGISLLGKKKDDTVSFFFKKIKMKVLEVIN